MATTPRPTTGTATTSYTLADALLASDSQPLRANRYLPRSTGEGAKVGTIRQDIVTVARQQYSGGALPNGKHFNYTVSFVASGAHEGDTQEFETLAAVAAYVYERWEILMTMPFWEPVDTLRTPYAEAWSGGRAFLRNWPRRES